MKPNFIGIGAQKCASTWVYKVLQDHPQAYVSEPKELNFFSYYYNHGFQWYERFFENTRDRIAVGEISPSYFNASAAPYRVCQYNSNMRVIVTLRDPVERAYSHHLWEVLHSLSKAEILVSKPVSKIIPCILSYRVTLPT